MSGRLEPANGHLGPERSSTDELFALISHELQGPLALITGYVELLADSEAEKLGENGRRWLEVIDRAARRESRLIRNLVLLGRLEAGGFTAESERLELVEVTASALEAMSPTARERGVGLRLETADEVPAMSGDRVRVQQALENLLEGAISFSAEDREIAVGVTAEAERAAIEISGPDLVVPEGRDELLAGGLEGLPQGGAEPRPAITIALLAAEVIAAAHGGGLELGADRLRMRLPLAPGPIRYPVRDRGIRH